jgi:hypothetical protein
MRLSRCLLSVKGQPLLLPPTGVAVDPQRFSFAAEQVDVPAGFERLEFPKVKSVLAIPTDWFSYEFGADEAEFFISGKEDVATNGPFDTGFSLAYYAFPDHAAAKQGAREVFAWELGGVKPGEESIRAAFLNEKWTQMGEEHHECELRQSRVNFTAEKRFLKSIKTIVLGEHVWTASFTAPVEEWDKEEEKMRVIAFKSLFAGNFGFEEI